MKLLQVGGGFTEDELRAFRYIVFSNCISQMKVLVCNSARLDFKLEEDNIVCYYFIRKNMEKY